MTRTNKIGPEGAKSNKENDRYDVKTKEKFKGS
jgi:hypothetical protein